MINLDKPNEDQLKLMTDGHGNIRWVAGQCCNGDWAGEALNPAEPTISNGATFFPHLSHGNAPAYSCAGRSCSSWHPEKISCMSTLIFEWQLGEILKLNPNCCSYLSWGNEILIDLHYFVDGFYTRFFISGYVFCC